MVFQDEILNKCEDLGIDFKLFVTPVHKAQQSKASCQQLPPPPPSQPQQQQLVDIGSLANRIDWLELSFFLGFQLQTLVLGHRRDHKPRKTPSGLTFPIELPHQQRQLWPKKKQKAVLLTLQQLQQVNGSWCCYHEQLKDPTTTARTRWMLVSDFFLSELQLFFMQQWRQQQALSSDTQRLQQQPTTQVAPCTTMDVHAVRVAMKPMVRNLETLCGSQLDPHDDNDEPLACWLDSCCHALAQLNLTTLEANGPTPAALDPRSMHQLNEFHKALHEDFALRKVLMKERCEVTLQSFFWASQIQKNPALEHELHQELYKIKQKCHTEPLHVDLDTFVQQSEPLEFGLVGKNNSCKLEEGASLRTVLMGQVPDRGGRTDEIKPNQFLRDNGAGHHRRLAGANFGERPTSNTTRKQTKSFKHHHSHSKKQKQ